MDKFLHSNGFLHGLFFYALTLTLSLFTYLIYAVIIAVLMGITKEIIDCYRYGLFCRKDTLNNGIGIAIAILVVVLR